MKNLTGIFLIAGTILFSLFFIKASAQKSFPEDKVLKATYNLAIDHSKEIQYFNSETRVQKLEFDGKRPAPDIFRLWLRCDPGTDGDRYTCLRFTIQSNDGPEISIPSLQNWSYIFKRTSSEKDEKGQVLGIDHAPFEKLLDSNGHAVPIDKSYHVYNAFIDFHSMNVFADKTPFGKGVQDLHHIGDKIVHYASFSEPPVNLGETIKEGSVFKNGEVTLYFKGVGVVNKKSCAVIEYDSGASSFRMIMKPMPAMEVNTTGSSHYWGDIFRDIHSGWIQKAVLHEIVVSETVIPGQANKIANTIERTINISNTTSLK